MGKEAEGLASFKNYSQVNLGGKWYVLLSKKWDRKWPNKTEGLNIEILKVYKENVKTWKK